MDSSSNTENNKGNEVVVDEAADVEEKPKVEPEKVEEAADVEVKPKVEEPAAEFSTSGVRKRKVVIEYQSRDQLRLRKAYEKEKATKLAAADETLKEMSREYFADKELKAEPGSDEELEEVADEDPGATESNDDQSDED